MPPRSTCSVSLGLTCVAHFSWLPYLPASLWGALAGYWGRKESVVWVSSPGSLSAGSPWSSHIPSPKVSVFCRWSFPHCPISWIFKFKVSLNQANLSILLVPVYVSWPIHFFLVCDSGQLLDSLGLRLLFMLGTVVRPLWHGRQGEGSGRLWESVTGEGLYLDKLEGQERPLWRLH